MHQYFSDRYDESSAALLTRAVAAEAAEAEATQARRRAETARAEVQARVTELEGNTNIINSYSLNLVCLTPNQQRLDSLSSR